jgi:hypothetical protein
MPIAAHGALGGTLTLTVTVSGTPQTETVPLPPVNF